MTLKDRLFVVVVPELLNDVVVPVQQRNRFTAVAQFTSELTCRRNICSVARRKRRSILDDYRSLARVQRPSRKRERDSLVVPFDIQFDELDTSEVNRRVSRVDNFYELEAVVVGVEFAELQQRAVRIVIDLGYS